MWNHGYPASVSPRHGFLPSPGKFYFAPFSTNGAHYSLPLITILVGYVFDFCWIGLFHIDYIVLDDCLSLTGAFAFIWLNRLLYVFIPFIFAGIVRSGRLFPRRFTLSSLWKSDHKTDRRQMEWILSLLKNSDQMKDAINVNLANYKKECDSHLKGESSMIS